MTCVNLHAQIQRDAGKIPHEQTEINIKSVDHQGFTFISGHHPLAVSPQSVSTDL